MIRLTSVGYGYVNNFFLLKESCHDGNYTATRTAVREAIKRASSMMWIKHRRVPASMQVSVHVSKLGPLYLGCHSFSETNSKRIIKWANARRKK